MLRARGETRLIQEKVWATKKVGESRVLHRERKSTTRCFSPSGVCKHYATSIISSENNYEYYFIQLDIFLKLFLNNGKRNFLDRKTTNYISMKALYFSSFYRNIFLQTLIWHPFSGNVITYEPEIFHQKMTHSIRYLSAKFSWKVTQFVRWLFREPLRQKNTDYLWVSLNELFLCYRFSYSPNSHIVSVEKVLGWLSLEKVLSSFVTDTVVKVSFLRFFSRFNDVE